MTGLGEGCGGSDGRRMLAQGEEATAEVRGGGGCRGGGRAAEGLVNGVKIKSSGLRKISLNEFGTIAAGGNSCRGGNLIGRGLVGGNW